MRRTIILLMSICLVMAAPALPAVTLIPAPPKINATSYLVMDFDSGMLIVNENADKRVEPASLTKIMTSYIAARELAAGHIHLDDKVHVSKKAWQSTGSRMFLEVNKVVTVDELLHGIIIQSGNDASVALAEHIAGDETAFSGIMNQQAGILGMLNTHFVNSTGMPNADHFSTAHDLAILSRALIREFPGIYSLHSQKEFYFNNIKQVNRNSLLWQDDSVDGVKTGHTESAGYCLVASAKRGEMRLISVVMGTDGENARIKMTQALLNYAFRFFETHKLYSANHRILSDRVWKGDTASVALGINRDLYITIPKGSYRDLNAEIEINTAIIAPVTAGEVRGKLKVTLEGRDVAVQPMVTLQTVGAGSLYGRIRDDIELLFE